MYLKCLNVMFVWLFFLGNVISAPEYEFPSLEHEEELSSYDETHIKYIVPGGYPSHKSQQDKEVNQLEDLVAKDNEHYKIFKQHYEAGHVMKGLTFTIYDDNMREAAIALFRLMQFANVSTFRGIREWAHNNINKDVLDYAFRVASLYNEDELNEKDPPFMSKPNFFINGEVFKKALKLKLANGKFDAQDGQTNQIFREKDIVTINTNYSGWDLWNEDCADNLEYFREDISLNSYYYGVHLLYPFWMSNDELTGVDPTYAKKYYYIHHQLLARYNLEKEHLKQRNISTDSNCSDDFIPYLNYDNGLPFPPRLSIRGKWNKKWSEEYARLKSIDIAIKECITRGVIFMDNGTKVDLTEDNYVDLLTKLIRANYESNQTSKVIRALFGYGGIGHPTDRYSPAPSLLHHPQTTLRDPIFWYMIQNVFKYFTEYSNTLEPYNFTKYKSDDIEIVDKSFSKITTYYDYYQINLNKFFDDYDVNNSFYMLYTARQKRLTHLPFSITFTVNSKLNKTFSFKLFLGPQCQEENCWNNYSQFYEIDYFNVKLEEGLNLVKWSSDASRKYSYDDYYNIELSTSRDNYFDMFQFPESLVVPKGLNEGLNLTLFVLFVGLDDNNDIYLTEPLGFPFHREVLRNSTNSNNYKFYNISVYHKENIRENMGYFSPQLN